VLGALVDGAHDPGDGPAAVGTAGFPRPQPTHRQLAVDAMRQRGRAVRRLPGSLIRLVAAAGQLRSVAGGRLARSSLNLPTGPRREFTSIRVPLAAVLGTARAHSATVNDVLLVAIAAALHRLLAARGERLDDIVVSVPFSARQQTGAGQLGNASGVIPLRIPAVGDAGTRLQRVAALSRAARRSTRGASTALIGPLFRLLARLGLYRRFINGQRRIHTFTSNVRGPAAPQTMFGCPVTALLPLSAPTGNVTVAFAALSYAGTLAITVVADPDACPDLAVLRSLLVEELDRFMAVEPQSHPRSEV
ncbi:MAG: WS/DGAT domain-containing protein, partial [Cryobacterium sp.]